MLSIYWPNEWLPPSDNNATLAIMHFYRDSILNFPLISGACHFLKDVSVDDSLHALTI